MHFFQLHHGDYLRIDLPPHPRIEAPTQAIACCLRQGHHLRDVQRIYDQAETPFEWEPLHIAEEGTDDQSLLQTHTRCLTAKTVAHAQRPGSEVKQISLVDLLPPPRTTQIDFSAVQWFWHKMRHVSLGYWTSWPDDFEIPDVTQEELRRLATPSSQPPRMIHFYVDGSQIQSHVGAGIACLVEHDEGTFLAGCMAKAVEDAHFAFQGEHAAMVWALLWAIRISDWCLHEWGVIDLHFAFNFDAMNTGYQTAGYWRTKEHSHWRTMLRSLAQVLQHRHRHSHFHWNHVKAHSQHPLNELVDALAKFAATHPERVEGSSSWMRWFQDPEAMINLQWMWYIEYTAASPGTAPQMNGTIATHFNNVVPDVPDIDPAVPPPSAPVVWTRVQVSLKLATANVLTMTAGSRLHGTSRTKQHLLQKQFHDEGCTVVGVQETRHRHIVDPNNDLYHIIGHAAAADGIDGVQLWFSKRWPVFDSGPLIQRQHITVVSSMPSYLIARLCMPHFRAIFVTGRAPHSGTAQNLNERFWRQISQAVRPSYERDHLLFFMGDTNGHLGEHLSDAVGSHDGSQENGPGREFHNWMLSHQLCAPSTMTAYHVGHRSSTFCSPDGVHRTRIDYIAVPTILQYDHLSTWVADTIDLCGAREDHAAVIGWLQFHPEISSQKERQRPPPRLDRRQLSQHLGDPETLHHLADALHDAPWSLDPHQSAEYLASQTSRALFSLIPKASRWRRKRHISEEIFGSKLNRKSWHSARCAA